MKHPVKGKYVGVICGSFAALDILINACLKYGYELPKQTNLSGNQWLVREHVLSKRQWRDFMHRPDVVLALSWVFITSGATTTLSATFNPSSNTFYAIGAGGGGSVGSGGGAGGGGGGGGCSLYANFPGTANATYNILVGAGDTWFDNTGVLLAKAGSPGTQVGAALGGQASAGAGTTRFSGGTGEAPLLNNGGGGGGAAGPNGGGFGGSGGTPCAFTGGSGGAGDAGSGGGGGAGATQFVSTPGNGGNGTELNGTAGSGGGGGGCSSNWITIPGGNGGAYGGGGGGGMGQQIGCGCPQFTNGGSGFQGLLAYSYVPFVQGATATAWALILT